MTEKSTLTSLTSLFTTACIIGSFVIIMEESYTRAGLFYPLAFLVYAPGLYLLNRLFLRRDRTMRALVILNGGLCTALFIAIAVFGQYGSIPSLIFALLFVVYLTVRAAMFATQAPALRSLLLGMEFALVSLVIFVAFSATVAVPIGYSAIIIAGSACSILGVMLHRMERAPSLRTWCFIALAYAGIFFVLWLLMSFVAEGAGQGIVSLWGAFTDAVKFVFSQLARFIMFLVSLIPQTELMPMESESMEIALPEMAEAVPVNGYVTGAIAIVIIAAALFGLVRLFMHLGKIRLGSVKAVRVQASHRRRLSLMDALRRFLGEMRARVRLRVRIWKKRNTPEGLLCILIHKCRRTPWLKQVGETPREFLLRLSESADDARLGASILELSQQLQLALYSRNATGQTFPEAGLIRRKLSATVRRRYFKSLGARARLLLPRKGRGGL